MFSFLPAFKNILVHLTTLAVKIQVTNQTGKLFELPVAPVGFTPYPACNRHHQDLTGPKAQESQSKPSICQDYILGGLDPNTYHITNFGEKTPATSKAFWLELSIPSLEHSPWCCQPGAFTRQCWNARHFGHQGFLVGDFFVGNFLVKNQWRKNLSFHLENVYKSCNTVGCWTDFFC